MEQTRDKSATAMPTGWIAACALLLLLRVGFTVWESAHPRTALPTVAWQEYSKLDSDSLKGNLVLYEFYADWCDPCKKMESTALTNQQIRDLVGRRFVTVRVTDRVREDGKNSQSVTDLQKKFRIFAFPTLVVASPRGEAMATLVGSCSSLTTYRFLTRALTPNDTVENLKKQLRAGAALGRAAYGKI